VKKYHLENVPDTLWDAVKIRAIETKKTINEIIIEGLVLVLKRKGKNNG